jgi:hypothetical protein
LDIKALDLLDGSTRLKEEDSVLIAALGLAAAGTLAAVIADETT